MKYIANFDQIKQVDVPQFGGKNASLGQMIRELGKNGIAVPGGFATTAQAYWHHIESNGLLEQMKTVMAELTDIHDLKKLQNVGARMRALVADAPLPDDLSKEIEQAYGELSKHYHPTELCDVAVRSSATAEDLPEASFAGQQETFLHIQGIENLLEACRKSMASLFTDRAIVYRREHGFNDFDVALSVGVQKMIRSDLAAAGVMFTLDTETGFRDAISISSAYGLGETVVQGTVNPDEFCVHKPMLEKGFKPIIKKFLGSKEHKLSYHNDKTVIEPVAPAEQHQFSLSDDEVLKLAQYGVVIENYYSELHGRWSPMDIEWAKDGIDGKLYIVQARPETVHSRKKIEDGLVVYGFEEKPAQKTILVVGRSVGSAIATGKARVVGALQHLEEFHEGDIIVTDMTDPDWVPLMKKAGAIVTNRGGRTCHAAIVSRELGIPAVIGTGSATQVIADGADITIDCTQGSEGVVYDGIYPFKKTITHLDTVPKIPIDLLVNIGNPDAAFHASFLPVDGVGLARLEFIISSILKVHPMSVISPDIVEDEHVREQISLSAAGYTDTRTYFVQVLAQSIGMIAGAFYPRPVLVRLSDFKTNEYRDLLGGSYFEPVEENPMLGFRGAARYCSESYGPAFELECEALKYAREVMGFDNIKIMVPFVRTLTEAQASIDVLDRNGLKRGENGLKVFMMVEIPSNVLLIEEFAQYFDGFSIGSNDLTQLTLGVDRDSGELARLFDERDSAVKCMLQKALEGAKKSGTYIGICGQAPSDFPELAKFLIDQGINSLSLISDTVIPFLMEYQ